MKRLFFLSVLLSNIVLFGMVQGPVAAQQTTSGAEIKAIEDILFAMCSVGENNIGSKFHIELKMRAIALVNKAKDSSRDPFVLALAALFDDTEKKFKYAEDVVELMKARENNNVPQTNPRSRADTVTVHRRALSETALSKLIRLSSFRYKSSLTAEEKKQQLLAQIHNEVVNEAIELYTKHKAETH